MALKDFPIGNGTPVTDGNNTIPNGLPAAVMRQSMENKNLLQKKGAIYAGTGGQNTVDTSGIEGASDSVKIAQTNSLNPPDNVNTGADTYILTYTGDQAVPGTTEASPVGLAWQALSALGIKGAVGIITSSGGSTDIGTWSGSSAPYTYTISPAKHNLGATSNIFVQLMYGPSPYEIVGATVKVADDGTITINSNIKWSGKVILFAIS